MKISDIIKSDEERLFVVDRECFIIFTGDDIIDEKPFIRIGTWMELPPEIIPLTENIIITDNIIGTPTIEQFNINIRDLKSNRYVGSNNVIEKYLNFQKVFDLDLQNAAIVKIENNLSELSKEKNISEKNQYIGLFYKNGNFKTLFNNNTIFDLEKQHYISTSDLLNDLSKKNKESLRYSGSGFINLLSNPIFYNNNLITCSNLDETYLETFSKLQIDPNKIKEFFSPIVDTVKISNFIKWKNNNKSNIKIISNNSDEIREFKQIYSKSNILTEKFSGINHNTGSGLKLKNITNSDAIILSYSIQSKDDLKVIIINHNFDQKIIIKEKPDFIIISYSIFEKNSLALKSYSIPIIISDDNNKNISKLSRTNSNVIFSGIQYDFSKISDSEDLSKYLKIDSGLSKLIFNDDIKEIENHFSIFKSETYTIIDIIELFNTIAFIKLRIFSTIDREKASSLWDLYFSLKTFVSKKIIEPIKDKIKINLVLINNTVLQIAKQIEVSPNNVVYEKIETYFDNDEKITNDDKQFYRRVIEDRKRLEILLKLYKENSPYYIKNTVEIKQLAESIKHRKDYYKNNIDQIMSQSSQKKSKTTIPISFSKSIALTKDKKEGTTLQKINYKYIIYFAVLSLFLSLLYLKTDIINKDKKDILFSFYNSKELNSQVPQKIELDKEKQSSILNAEKIKTFVKQIPKNIKNKYKISYSDIFRYANSVAIKNGYAPIELEKLKDKNPHWIFPENIFILLDNKKIIVLKGDTLWGISKNKLIEMNYNFDKIIKENANKKFSKEQLVELEKFVFSRSLKRKFKTLKKKNSDD